MKDTLLVQKLILNQEGLDSQLQELLKKPQVCLQEKEKL